MNTIEASIVEQLQFDSRVKIVSDFYGDIEYQVEGDSEWVMAFGTKIQFTLNVAESNVQNLTLEFPDHLNGWILYDNDSRTEVERHGIQQSDAPRGERLKQMLALFV